MPHEGRALRRSGLVGSLARDHADRHLAGTDFTIFMVSQSESSRFGVCGNGIWGSGGDPRLYLQRGAFRYHELGNVIALYPTNPNPTISVFMHDSQETILAARNGSMSELLSGVPIVSEFGGGNLAIPFWSGNETRAGDMAEIAVYDRLFSPVERVGVETYLAEKYSIQYARQWERE